MRSDSCRGRSQTLELRDLQDANFAENKRIWPAKKWRKWSKGIKSAWFVWVFHGPFCCWVSSHNERVPSAYPKCVAQIHFCGGLLLRFGKVNKCPSCRWCVHEIPAFRPTLWKFTFTFQLAWKHPPKPGKNERFDPETSRGVVWLGAFYSVQDLKPGVASGWCGPHCHPGGYGWQATSPSGKRSGPDAQNEVLSGSCGPNVDLFKGSCT